MKMLLKTVKEEQGNYNFKSMSNCFINELNFFSYSEILNKEKPLHNAITWPRAIMLREHGYFCKNQMNTRFENHRKVFERQFHGSLNAVERLELMSKLDLHYSCVNSLSFSRNGNYLLSGSDDLRIIMWDWKTGAHKSDHRTKHTKNIFQVKFSIVSIEC